MEKRVADFFAGIGLVRYALEGCGWQESFAVDYDPKKREMYDAHFQNSTYLVRDIRSVSADEVPSVTLAHASFPCTDLSVAGARHGLDGAESSAFWEFVRLLEQMDERRPPLVLLENVTGFLTSAGGEDLRAALMALCQLGYAVDIVLIDAAHFVPQSRVRLFIIGELGATGQNVLEQEFALNLLSEARPPKLQGFIRSQPALTWKLQPLPPLPQRTLSLEAIVDSDEPWWPQARAAYLYSQMYERHQQEVQAWMQQAQWLYGTVFRRTRWRDGKKRSTAELRTDGIAGCLRTPKGGSARQILLRAGHGHYEARLLNARENARLMGADNYHLDVDLPLNQALWGFGDAVCVPVVQWVAEHLLHPRLDTTTFGILGLASKSQALMERPTPHP